MIRVYVDVKNDIQVWIKFLQHINGTCKFSDSIWITNEQLKLNTDSTGNVEIQRLVNASVSVNRNRLYQTTIFSVEAFRMEYHLNPILSQSLSHVTTFIACLSLNNKTVKVQ